MCEHVAEREPAATHTACLVHTTAYQKTQLFLDILDTVSRTWSLGRAQQIQISSDQTPSIPHICLWLDFFFISFLTLLFLNY